MERDCRRRNCEARDAEKSAEILESRSVVALEITQISLISGEFTEATSASQSHARQKQQPRIAVALHHLPLLEKFFDCGMHRCSGASTCCRRAIYAAICATSPVHCDVQPGHYARHVQAATSANTRRGFERMAGVGKDAIFRAVRCDIAIRPPYIYGTPAGNEAGAYESPAQFDSAAAEHAGLGCSKAVAQMIDPGSAAHRLRRTASGV